MISIDIYGEPVPQARHRHAKSGNKVITYDPTSKLKEGCKWQMRSQYRDKPLGGPVSIILTFFMPIPKNTSKVRREEMLGRTYHHIKKPDVDNLQKFVFDCMNELILEDDSQIVEIQCKKIYSDNPGTNIKIIPLQSLRSNKIGNDIGNH